MSTLQPLPGRLGLLHRYCDSPSHGGQRTFRHLLRSSNEAVRDHFRFQPGPPRSVDDVECFTLAWIDRYNSARPHTRLGNAPPAEYEAAHCAEPTKSSRPAMTPA
ncbi:integrase core domain-containing protein [Citricoccus nitrophenolicus]|uniref:integrase core domain-containing protein n=1 Tax=Citricoccus nitrophenolicus TaxID=863575 RepID=UPI003D767A33